MFKLNWKLFPVLAAFGVYNIAYAQAEKLDLAVRNRTLKQFITQIEKETDYTFMLDQTVDQNQKITVDSQQESLEDILAKAFAGKQISYEIVGKQIILKLPHTTQTNQIKKITGVIKDQNGEPVIGANVSVKGTAIGTITDLDGNFMLEVPEDAIISVSYIGYVSQEVKVGNKTLLNISLKEDLQTLDEIVVVGYGTQKKVNLTGAVTAVSGEEMTKRPVTNTSTMLQGQIPGLRVVQGTGQPGDENVSFRIRGVGTFSGAGSNPLVLVNGVPGDMSALDPSMIESVSVLKDAASCAIYGARAANGVILITTKQGATNGDKVSISYSGNFAVHTPTKMFDLVTNSADYMTLFNIAKRILGKEVFIRKKKLRNIEIPMVLLSILALIG